MPDLTPEEIETTTFPSSLRGYDRDAVDFFLQDVAAAFEAALNEGQAARETRQKPYQSLGEEMGDLLQHAKDSADQTRREAESAASATMRSAEEAASRTRAEAEQQAALTLAHAEKEAAARIEEAAETVEQLETMEQESRAELRRLRVELEGVVEQLRSLEPSDDTAGLRAVGPAQEGPGMISVDGAEEGELGPSGSELASSEALRQETSR